MKSKKRSGAVFANPFQAAASKQRIKTRREADQRSGDRLTILPSSLLSHLLLPCFTFEEQMTDIRQINKTLHSHVERSVLPWMNERFGRALAIIEREERKKQRKERDSQWMRDWATSSASPSSSIVAAPPSSAASFHLADAMWVSRQLKQWRAKVYNRSVSLGWEEMELLRVPWTKVASHFLLPPATVTALSKAGRRADRTVSGRAMAVGFWLLDLLHLVFQQHGHISNFLPLYKARRMRKAQQRSQQLQEREWNGDPGRLKAAMEAQGLDWSEWT